MEQWLVSLIATALQTAIILAGAFIAIGGARVQLENLDKRMDRVEAAVIQVARQDERLNAMDQRMLAQGERLDRVQSVQSSLIRDVSNAQTKG